MQGANLAAHLVLLAIMGAIVCHGSRVRTYIDTRIEACMVILDHPIYRISKQRCDHSEALGPQYLWRKFGTK